MVILPLYNSAAEMDSQPTASIVVSNFYSRKIGYLLKRLTERTNHSNDSVKPYFKNHVQMVDWVEAIFTDAQLKAAIQLIRDRHELSSPPVVS